MIELTLEEVESTISKLERQYPDFKEVYENDEICSCCKVDYNSWDFEKIESWGTYESRRFLLGGVGG